MSKILDGFISIGFNSKTQQHYKAPATIYVCGEYAAVKGKYGLYNSSEITAEGFIPATVADRVIETLNTIEDDEQFYTELNQYEADLRDHEKGIYTDRFMGYLV